MPSGSNQTESELDMAPSPPSPEQTDNSEDSEAEEEEMGNPSDAPLPKNSTPSGSLLVVDSAVSNVNTEVHSVISSPTMSQPASSPPPNTIQPKVSRNSREVNDENEIDSTTGGVPVALNHADVGTEILHASKTAEIPNSHQQPSYQSPHKELLPNHAPSNNHSPSKYRASTDPDGVMPCVGGSQTFTAETLAAVSENRKPVAADVVNEAFHTENDAHIGTRLEGFRENQNLPSVDEGQFPIKEASIDEGQNPALSHISVGAPLPESMQELSSPSSLDIPMMPSILPRMNSTGSTENVMQMLEQPSMRMPTTHGNILTPVPGTGAFTSYSMHSMATNIQSMPSNAQAVQPIPTLPASIQSMSAMPPAAVMIGGGKRKIHIRLVEDVRPAAGRRSFLNSFRRARSVGTVVTSPELDPSIEVQGFDRGRMTISWYEGTTSLELQEHVRSSVIRKLGLGGTVKLDDFRILDESVHPPEEIVLCPYIPDGSKFLLRFTTKDAGGDMTPVGPLDPRYGRAVSFGPPDSPSAAPSPHPVLSDLDSIGLSANQLALVSARLKQLQRPPTNQSETHKETQRKPVKSSKATLRASKKEETLNPLHEVIGNGSEEEDGQKEGKSPTNNSDDDAQSKSSSNAEMRSLHPEDPIEARLRQITELLIADRTNKRYVPRRQEKRQAVFTLANYFVLFLSLIAISAEIQARAPQWVASMEQQLKSVQNCATDQDALFQCVSNGDFAGLIASVVLWLSRSAATKRIFLFGFESTQKLWTVVYESLVTAVCWGFSYMFIRRGMNPDTNRNFLQKYWKDAVYGSLAGFNAAFMKHVLKNLIPQEAIEDALQDRQLKILSWLPSFAH